MKKSNCSFTAEDRMSILQEAERMGFMETCCKYNLSPNLLSTWKRRYLLKASPQTATL